MPELPFNLQLVDKGQSISHDDHNALVRAVQSLGDFIADEFVEPSQFKIPQIPIKRLGTIQTIGPNGEDEPAGANYWVAISSPALSISGTDLLDSNDSPEIPTSFPEVVCATNLAELPISDPAMLYGNGMGQHALMPGTRVELSGESMQSDSTLIHWNFTLSPERRSMKIVGYLGSAGGSTGGGRYAVQVVRQSPYLVDKDSNFDMPESPNEVLPDVEYDAIYENLWEQQITGSHLLQINIFVDATLVGRDSENPVKPLYRSYATPDPVTIRITGTVGTGGSYTGHCILGYGVNVDVSGSTSIPNNGETEGTQSIVFENSIEDGATGWGLPVDGTCLVIGHAFGTSNENPVRAIFRGNVELCLVGTYCIGTSPTYVAIYPILRLYFHHDNFLLTQPPGQSSWMLVDWNGFTVMSHYSSPDHICHVKVLDFDQAFPPSTNEGNIDKGATGSGIYWNYPVSWKMVEVDDVDPCATCPEGDVKVRANLKGTVQLDPCDFLPSVMDCHGTDLGKFKTHKFQKMLKVTAGTECKDDTGSGSVSTVDVDLTVDPTDGDPYLKLVYEASPTCGATLKLGSEDKCIVTSNSTSTVDVVGDCASGWIITVTLSTESIRTLKAL